MNRQRREQAVVVGSGPNGLAAAIELARRGIAVDLFEAAETIGGGTRTAALMNSEVVHDLCSAAHPLGAGSPFFSSLPLAEHGLDWMLPDVQMAHPLGEGRSVGLMSSLADTVDRLGNDGAPYRRLVEPWVSRSRDALAVLLQPPHLGWRRPVTALRFGTQALLAASRIAARFDTDGRALIAGLGAHAIAPLNAPATGGVALTLAAAAHVEGWPVARGGSQSIANALGSYLESLGGRIHTGHQVDTIAEWPGAAIFMDTAPGAAATIAAERISARSVARLERFRHGPPSFKVDWILSDPIPWLDDLSPQATSVHVGGSYEEIAASERLVAAGQAPEAPFVIVTQPTVVDPSRAPQGTHVAWGYCHVPRGFDGDLTAAIESQIERFAPGFSETIAERHVMSPSWFSAHNPNYVGGDIAGGAFNLRNLLARPQATLNPYRIGADVYLCSASTPPGSGVHGMCGYNAVALSGL